MTGLRSGRGDDLSLNPAVSPSSPGLPVLPEAGSRPHSHVPQACVRAAGWMMRGWPWGTGCAAPRSHPFRNGTALPRWWARMRRGSPHDRGQLETGRRGLWWLRFPSGHRGFLGSLWWGQLSLPAGGRATGTMGLELEEGLRTLSVGQLNIHGTPGAVSKVEASDSAGGSERSLRSALPARCTEAAGPRRPGLPGRYPVGFRSVFVFP